MTSKQLEELADELLRQDAKTRRKSNRQLGTIDDRRARTVREREVPFATYFAPKRREQ